MMWFKFGLINALIACLMQVMVLLSPLFLNDTQRSYCIQISQFAKYAQQHLAHRTQNHQKTSTQQLNAEHHQYHQSHQEQNEKHIYLQHCDLCLLHAQLILLNNDIIEIIQRIQVVLLFNQRWIDLSIILTPILFLYPPAQAPPQFLLP